MKTIAGQARTDSEVAAWYNTHDRVPTVIEVAAYAGVSTSSAQKLLQVLEASGAISGRRTAKDRWAR